MAKKAYVGVARDNITNPGPFSATTGWTANQDVTISIESSVLKVVSNQSTSTPGVWFTFSSTLPAGTYRFTCTVSGSSNFSVGGRAYAPNQSSNTAFFGSEITTSPRSFDITMKVEHEIGKILIYMNGMSIGSYIKISKAQFTGGVARKVKKGYVGIQTAFPIYSEETRTVAITANNISDYFTVTNESYYFVGSGNIFSTNNAGVDSSTASTVLTAKYDISALSFNYSYSSEANYDKFTLKVAGTTVENAVSGSTTSKSYSGSLKAGQTIEFTYAKDNSQSKNDDKCTFSAMNITTVVRTQTGTEMKSVARKIKKAYVGVGGVARPCWPGLSYYGTITSLQSSRSYLMATSVGNYALFGGGYQFGDVSTDDVDVYDSSLTHTILDVYWNHNGQGLSRGAATTVGNVAMFAGGISTDNSTVGQNHGYAYNSSLTGLGRFYLGGKSYDPSATSIGDYALFSHGTSTRYYDPQGTRATKITAINASLTTSTPTAPDTSAGGRASTVVGNYALFAGGTWREEFSDDYTMHYVTIVDAYNSSLTHSTAPALDVSRTLFAGVSISGHALFTGANSSTQTAVVYDSSLTRTLINSTATGSNLKGTTLKSGSEEFAFIGGGGSTTIYVFDTSLTERTAEFNMKFSSAKSNCAATTIGQFAIFAGGSSSDAEAITM